MLELLDWEEIYDGPLPGFWQQRRISIAYPNDLILRFEFDTDWDNWEQHSRWYKSYIRFRVTHDEYGLVVSPSQAIYPKVEQEIRTIFLGPDIPVFHLQFKQYVYNGKITWERDLLPLNLNIKQVTWPI